MGWAIECQQRSKTAPESAERRHQCTKIQQPVGEDAVRTLQQILNSLLACDQRHGLVFGRHRRLALSSDGMRALFGIAGRVHQFCVETSMRQFLDGTPNHAS